MTSANNTIFTSNMSSTNVSNKLRNEIITALKFHHEGRLHVSYYFEFNKNAAKVSLKLLCNETSP